MGGNVSTAGLTQYDFETVLASVSGPENDDSDPVPGNSTENGKKMEAEYVGYYLGSSMLTKGTTGLGVIQKPLRDKYFNFRKSPDNKLGPEIGIRVNPRGLVLLFPGAHPNEPNDEFYELPSIHFIEAVQFVTMKHKDKKMYGAFVPIADDTDANQEKLFVQLEKKNNHLTKIQHPPMVACVMRRPTGVKAVDCHMFVIPVVQDALQLADMVHRFQERPVHPDQLYDRPPPDRREMYRPEPDVIPRNIGPRKDPPPARSRDSNEDYEIYRGRSFELRQDHFVGGAPRPSDLRVDEPDRTFDSDRGPPSSRGSGPYDRSPQEEPRDYRRQPGGPRYNDREPPPDRRSRELAKPNGAFVERDAYGREYEFDNRVVHERQRSGGLSSNDRFEMSRQNSGGRSPRNEYMDRSDEYGGRMNRSSDNFPGRHRERSPEPHRGPPPSWQPPRGLPRNEARDYDEPPYPRPFRSDGRRSPPLHQRGRSPPPTGSPPRGHSSPRRMSPERDEIYSASNLESRQEEVAHPKPIAKVIPNRHAGVRVLPSLPIPGAKSHLKPVSPRASDPPSKVDDQPPTYNFTSPHTQSSDEESPYDNAPEKRAYRPTRALSDRSPEPQRRDYREQVRADNNSNRTKSYDYSYERESDRNNLNTRNGNTKQWSYEDEKEKFLKGRDSNHGREAPGPQNRNHDQDISERGGQHMKDLEIADMFSNLRTSNQPRDVDFESSLGYLP